MPLDANSARYNAFLWQNQQNRDMKTSLPSLAAVRVAGTSAIGVAVVAVVALAISGKLASSTDPGSMGIGSAATTAEKASVDRAAGSLPNGNDLLRNAAVRLSQFPSFEARVRQQIDLFGHRLIGSGLFQQQGGGWDALLRVELRMTAADQTSSLLQVCDGRFLWTHVDLGGNATLRRVDVERLRNVERRPKPVPSAPALALGGMPSLVESLADSFSFVAVESIRIDRFDGWLLRGEWSASRLCQLLPDQSAAIRAGGAADLRKLPPHLPDLVVVVLGRDDGIPYRVEYRRRWTADNGGTEGGDGRVLLVMELFDVRLGGPIDRRQFHYQPGDLPAVDDTERYLTTR
jgi:hypothetical protein